ncbi:hypothetical protein D3C86_1440940 [compost metagenome]
MVQRTLDDDRPDAFAQRGVAGQHDVARGVLHLGRAGRGHRRRAVRYQVGQRGGRAAGAVPVQRLAVAVHQVDQGAVGIGMVADQLVDLAAAFQHHHGGKRAVGQGVYQRQRGG